jgi:signal transduction histidine kinase/CheY-like chemotaxis protein
VLLFELDTGRVRGTAAAATALGLSPGQALDLPLRALQALLDAPAAMQLAAHLGALAAGTPPTGLQSLQLARGGVLSLRIEPLGGPGPRLALASMTVPGTDMQLAADAAPPAGHSSLAVLAGGIAHDFNNLLVGVMGNLDLARYADDVGTGTQRHLDAALAAAERAAELCRQLLAFSGNGPVRAQVKDMNDELRRVAPLLRQSTGHDAVLAITTGPGPLPAALDSGLFVQLLLNLLANAAEASRPGDEIRVATAALDIQGPGMDGPDSDGVPAADAAPLHWIDHPPAPGRYVQLGVTDHGAGMSEAVLARAFEPLFSTRGEGRGLGLPAVQGIVRQHGGCIGVRSAPGAGTTVLVLLPATSAAASTAARPPRRAREGTVLIVDDEPTVRDVLRLQLERLGYRTRAVENGLLALAHVRAHAGELLAVVLDQTMPVMGGAEAYRHLREIAPRLPVVLTTGYGEENLLELIAGDVHAAFLPKPFALGRLREVLEHVTS